MIPDTITMMYGSMMTVTTVQTAAKINMLNCDIISAPLSCKEAPLAETV